MKQLLVFIRKEFYHVFRDRRTLLILFGLPVVQIVLFGFALSSEVKNIRLVVSDNARDINSKQIIDKIKSSAYFIVDEKPMDYPQLEKAFKQGEVKAALIFPPDFGNDLLHTGNAQVQIITDGSDPNISKIVVNYLTSILGSYRQQGFSPENLPYRITTETRMLYNEEGNGSLNFIPGVMSLIFMIVCTALTSVAVVKEKELGTMEVLLVSPFKPVFVLISKAVPYLLLSIVNFTVIMLLTVFLLHVEIRGSILLLLGESTLFIITCLSLGLLISSVTNSQQAALLASLMGMMLPTLIFTGFINPIENMPLVFRIISHIVPARWYFLIIKSVMLKGLGFTAVWKETLVLLFMTLALLGISLKNFKTRLQ
ncbi:ABC transporter permease [Chitinophagaceae bacterium MMS25-I14]